MELYNKYKLYYTLQIFLISLGCSKNLVDSEHYLGILSKRKGMELTSELSEADIVIVNTCGFIGDAKEESIETILEVSEFKETGNLKKLIVAGCLAQKYSEEILKEPNFQTAEKALTDFCGPMDGEFRNLLVDIIVERWIDTPKDVPFSYARSIWNRKDINREEYQALLEEIRSYPIAPINKAKISDFLWVVENDFSNAKIAETAYYEHLKNTGAFADHIMAINRILFISKKIRSKEINEEVRKNLLIKVLEEYDNSSHAKIGYLIKTAMEEKVDTGYLIPYVENILKTYDDNSCDAPLIGKFCDLLEELYCRKNNWQKKKCITEPKLIAIRRRKIQAIRMEAEYAGASSKGNLMRKIHYLKEVIQLLKTIQGTEEERKALLQEIAQKTAQKALDEVLTDKK